MTANGSRSAGTCAWAAVGGVLAAANAVVLAFAFFMLRCVVEDVRFGGEQWALVLVPYLVGPLTLGVQGALLALSLAYRSRAPKAVASWLRSLPLACVCVGIGVTVAAGVTAVAYHSSHQEAVEQPPALETSGLASAIRADDAAKVTAIVSAHATLLFERDAVGNTALHLAPARGDMSFVRQLLDPGADPLAFDSLGDSPLTLAQEGGHGDVARILDELVRSRSPTKSRTGR